MDSETTTQPVPTSGDFPAPAMPASIVAHREAFARYVVGPDIEPWHRAHLTRLYQRWAEYNAAHFGGQMVRPYIMLATPSEPGRFGDCGPFSGFGGKSQIRIRASLQRGTHPRLNGWKAEECTRLVDDILLHEMIHQWQQEVVGEFEESYHGHGSIFRDKANEIGARLGLAPVRTCKKRKNDRALPSCSQWPHNVRPADYYPAFNLPSESRTFDALLYAWKRATDDDRDAFRKMLGATAGSH